MKKIKFFLVLVLLIITLLILGFYVYLRFFWTLDEPEIYKKITYENLTTVYRNNSDKFGCAKNIVPDGGGIYRIRHNEGGMFRSEGFSINDKFIIYSKEKKFGRYDDAMKVKKNLESYDSLETLIQKMGYDYKTYLCLAEIIKHVDPFFVVDIRNGSVKFIVDGTFEVGYGIMYIFDPAKRKDISITYESGYTGILVAKQIEDGWYYFKER